MTELNTTEPFKTMTPTTRTYRSTRRYDIASPELIEDYDEPSPEELEHMKKLKKDRRTRLAKFETSITSSTGKPNELITRDMVLQWEEDLENVKMHLLDGKELIYAKMIHLILQWFQSKSPFANDDDDEYDIEIDLENTENTGKDHTQQTGLNQAAIVQQSTIETHHVDLTSLSLNGTPSPPRATPSGRSNPFSQNQRSGLPLPNSTPPLVISQQPLVTTNVPTSQLIGQQPQVGGYQPIQHPFTYTKITTEVDPFDGSPLNFGYFVKLFELKYETNPFMSPLDQFLKFSQLVGTHGKQFMRNLSPDANGLAEAKRRLKQHYGNKTTIELEAREQLNKLNPVTSDRQVGQLRYNLEKIESLVTSLTDCGVSLPVLNHSYYSSIVKKFPFTIINSFTLANNGEEDLTKVLAHIRKKMELSAQTAAAMGLPINNRPTSRINPIGSPPSEHTSHQNQYTSASQLQPSRNSRSFILKCNLCNGPHKTIFCNETTAAERKRIALQKKLCLLCLSQFHQLNECQSHYQCHCGGRHSKVICINSGTPQVSPRINDNLNTATSGSNNSQQSTVNQQSTSRQNELNTNDNSLSMNTISLQETKANESPMTNQNEDQGKHGVHNKTFSQTVLARIKGQTVRILLDSGADRSVITPELADKFYLNRRNSPIQTFASAYNDKRTSDHLYNTYIDSLDGSVELLTSLHGLSIAKQVKPGLTEEQSEQLKQSGYPINDVNDSEKSQYPIEITLGIDILSRIWESAPIPLANGLCVQRSIFGWVIYGRTSGPDPMNNFVPVNDSNRIDNHHSVNNQLEQEHPSMTTQPQLETGQPSELLINTELPKPQLLINDEKQENEHKNQLSIVCKSHLPPPEATQLEQADLSNHDEHDHQISVVKDTDDQSNESHVEETMIIPHQKKRRSKRKEKSKQESICWITLKWFMCNLQTSLLYFLIVYSLITTSILITNSKGVTSTPIQVEIPYKSESQNQHQSEPSYVVTSSTSDNSPYNDSIDHSSWKKENYFMKSTDGHQVTDQLNNSTPNGSSGPSSPMNCSNNRLSQHTITITPKPKANFIVNFNYPNLYTHN